MTKLRGKRLLILGGSRVSCEIVKKAQELGIYTMVTDWYPLERSPAKQIADKYFMTSTSDIPEMVQLIKDEEVDGVITGFTDSVLPYYAEMCKEAGLPHYGTKEQFKTLTDKSVYKRLCREFDVPVVDEYHISEEDLHTQKIQVIKYPVLVKPADGSGARGVYICNNPDELRVNYKQSLNYSQSKDILVERYIDGEEVTVFYLLDDGEIYLTGMGNRHVKHNQDGIIPLPVAYTFPSIYLKHYMEETDSKVKEMFRSLGMKNGMVFMQCLVKDGKSIVYDIGYRLTGTLEYKLIDAVSGYDPLEMLIRFALTGKMSGQNLTEQINPIWEKYACNVSFLMNPGTIKEIKGLDKIREIPGIVDVTLAREEGETLPESSKGMLAQIMLRVFATAETEDELKQKLDDIYHQLTVIGENKENLLLEGLDVAEVDGVLL